MLQEIHLNPYLNLISYKLYRIMLQKTSHVGIWI